MRFPAMQSYRPSKMAERGYAQRGLREVGLPAADAGLRGALHSIYALAPELPAEFAKLLDRLR